MDVIDAIRTRRSIRSYDSRPVPEDALNRVLEAGRIAPSAMNYQPWMFVVVRDPENKKVLSEGRYARFLAECPVVIVGCGNRKKSEEWHVVDVTIALQNMVTQATAEGLGTCWIGSFDEDRVRNHLEVPTEYSIVAMLALGYPKKVPAAPRKAKSMEEIVRKEGF